MSNTTVAIFFGVYSVALICLAFFGGAVWQYRRTLSDLKPPPLPTEVKTEPTPYQQLMETVSPYAPKPKQAPRAKRPTPYVPVEKWEKGKDNSPKTIDPMKVPDIKPGLAIGGKPPPETKPQPTLSHHNLPDIPWGNG